jgi:periodic tryptophan protein 1
MLSAYPLCLEWLPEWKTHESNLIVVGTFLPEIEIWNLDILDAIDPVCVLGGI